MATYNQISIINIERKREDGSLRNFEIRLLERDGSALSLPFDIEGEVTVEHGGRSDDILKPVKPSQVNFHIRTKSALADKLIHADPRQYLLTIRETNANFLHLEGYIRPDFPKYDYYKSTQTVQVTATGDLKSIEAQDADNSIQKLSDIFAQVNTELELTRNTDFYMRTRYNGQALSDPIPQRIWMTELGQLGEDTGNRYNAIQQIAQEFNLQVFQHDGKLIVADVYERFQNPAAVNVYRNGSTQDSEDVVVALDKTKILKKIGPQDRNPTGRRSTRIGRVIQQRRLPQREENAFPTQSLPKTLTGSATEIIYPGDFVAGDVVKVDELAGTADITPGYQPGTYPNTITMNFELLQFEFTDDNTGQIYYYDSLAKAWVTTEKWIDYLHQFFELPPSQQVNGFHYPTLEWNLAGFELAPIPEDTRGQITVRLKKDYTITEPGVDVNSGYLEMKLTAFDLPITFNDTPDEFYRQAIATNAPGETNVYPLFESDINTYSGERGAMLIGESDPEMADNEWIEEGTANLVSFIELTARRKAELMLGTADRIHLVVRDTTPISLLNIILFESTYYAPVCIRQQLFKGYQEVWMKPAPGLSYTYQSKYTYDPEEVPGAAGGISRNWVTNRIYGAFATSLATGAIARTTASQGPGLINAFQIDRQNLLVTGDKIFIVDQFTLNRYEFTVEADQGASYTLDIENTSVPTNIPSGSFIFSNARNILTGVLQSEYGFEVFSKINGVGVLTEDVSGVVKQLPVNTYTQIREGQNLAIALKTSPDPIWVTVVAEVISNLSAELSGTITSIPLLSVSETWNLADGEKIRLETPAGLKEVVTVDGAQTIDSNSTSITINQVTLTNTYPTTTSWVRVDAEQAYDVGLQNLPIQEQYVDAPAGAVLMVSGLEIHSRLHVDPARILASVEEEKKADAIGMVATTVPNPPATAVTSISLDNIDEDVQLLDGQKLRILNKAGNNEEIVVNGDQLLVAPADTLNIDSKTLNNEYVAGYAWVREPTYKITGRLTIEAGRIDANVTNINDNTTAVSGLTLTVDGHGTAIAALETHSNIAGGSSYSALTLRSDIDSANASITAAVDRVDDLETDSGTIIRSITEPTTRPSGEPLQEGDIWLDPSTYDPAATPPTDNTVKQWNGSAWVDFNGVIRSSVAGLELDVDDYRARAMLYTDKNGNIGYIDIQSSEEQSTIDISADQVKINGIVFDDGAGLIRSSDFNATNQTGWKLTGGTGSLLQIYNIEVWGTLKTVDLEEEMIVQGAIYMPSKSDPDIVISTSEGITIKGRSSWAQPRAINFFQSDINTTLARIWYGVTAPLGLRIESSQDVYITGEYEVELGSTQGGNTIKIQSNGNTLLESPSGKITLDANDDILIDTVADFKVIANQIFLPTGLPASTSTSGELYLSDQGTYYELRLKK